MNNSSKKLGPKTVFTQCPDQKGYLNNWRRWQWEANSVNNQSKGSAKKSSQSNDQPYHFEFILMSYNILAQDLLEGHAQLYTEHDPRALPWNQRYGRLMAEINTIQPDILCVQELQQNHVDHFRKGLSYNYGMLYKKRTGGEKTDGCAVLYRQDLLDLITHHEVEYFQPNVNKLNRENVAIIAKFALKNNPLVKLVVSTTHLLYNPRRQDIRLAQIQVLLAELDRLAFCGTLPNGTPQYDPVILCGDFNLQPFTAPYELLTKGFLRYDRLASRTLHRADSNGHVEQTGKLFLPPALGITDNCQHDNLRVREGAQTSTFDMTRLYHSIHSATKSNRKDSESESCTAESSANYRRQFSSGSLGHRFAFESAYTHHMSEQNRRATTYQDDWITVDYLFYTPYRSVAECSRHLPNWNLDLLGTYMLPTVQMCGFEIESIPNMLYGSDHFSLAGRFVLSIPKN
ncbi:protein angel [Anopheles nili]|uniref:protein angel n=1 Tax=Anopheles nili TaxID=185578 RepID=UPI00237A317D|nr:protein angel [Anopheles nili]